jgi:hypothetical protein
MTDVQVRDDGTDAKLAGLVGALVAPLSVVLVAFALWWISDRLLSVGPFDRATFGWAVVFPVWAIAPFAAGLAWRGLSPRQRTRAATICAVVVGGAVAAAIWQAFSFPACEHGAVRAPVELVLPAAGLGVVVGGGFAFGALESSGRIQADRRTSALVIGAVAQLGVVIAAFIYPSFISVGNGCLRLPT